MKTSNKGKIKMESQFRVHNRNANVAAKIERNITFQTGKAKENCSSKSICMVKLYTVYASQEQSHLL